MHVPRIPSSEITDEALYWSRREWLASVGLGVAGSLALPRALRAQELKPTPHDLVTGYNNFYEFGTGKDDPQSKEIRLYVRPTRPDRNLLRAVSLRIGPSQSLDGMKSGAVRAGS